MVMDSDSTSPGRLKTEQFRELLRELSRHPVAWIPGLRQLLVLVLVRIEARFLTYVIEERVTEAIEEWHEQEEILNPTVTWQDAQIEEKPSEVAGLPELRISAPWVDRE